MASLPTILLILAALSAGATVIAAIIAFRSQKEASSAIFPIVREEEHTRAQRARISIFVWIAVTALFLGGWLATLRLAEPVNRLDATPEPPTQIVAGETAPPTNTPVPPIESPATETPVPPESIDSAPAAPTDTPPPATMVTPEPGATPTASPTNTPSPAPTATATSTSLPPTNTPEPTATPTATASPEPSATPTNTLTPTPVAVPPASDRTPAPPGVRVGPIQFATELDDDSDPIMPTDTFTDGIPTIYAVFSYQGMSPGLNFKAIWYKNGAEVAREEGLWEWGRLGQSFAFLVPQGPGLYKLDLWINDTIVATKLFEIDPRPE